MSALFELDYLNDERASPPTVGVAIGEAALLAEKILQMPSEGREFFSPRNSPKGPEIQTRGAASGTLAGTHFFGELEMANLYEFSTCSDAEAVLSGVVRVSVIVAPPGSLLIIRMANNPHGNQNDGCAED